MRTLKCPTCGSEVQIRVGITTFVELVETEQGLLGSTIEEFGPSFISWYCENCGNTGDVDDQGKAKMRAVVTVQLKLPEKAKLVPEEVWA